MVGEADRLLGIGDPDDGGCRSEGFLAEGRHLRRHAIEHGWLIEEAGAVDGSTAKHQLCPGLHRTLDLIV